MVPIYEQIMEQIKAQIISGELKENDIFIKEEFSELKKYFDTDEYTSNDNIDGLLMALDDVITDVGFDENYELNKEGLKLQLIYDQIYNQN